MRSRRRQEGLVLVEVMMALILLAICLVPLALLLDRLSAGLQRAEQRWAATGNEEQGRTEEWDWGPRVIEAEWRPDGSLALRTASGGNRGSLEIGVWVGGWLAGQVTAGADGRATVSTATFVSAQPGDEVLVRVRSEHAAWGVPWRLVKPGQPANPGETGVGAAGPGDAAIGGRGGSALSLTIHSLYAGASVVGISAGASSEELVLTAPLPCLVPTGDALLTMGSEGQHITMREMQVEARDVHVYF